MKLLSKSILDRRHTSVSSLNVLEMPSVHGNGITNITALHVSWIQFIFLSISRNCSMTFQFSIINRLETWQTFLFTYPKPKYCWKEISVSKTTTSATDDELRIHSKGWHSHTLWHDTWQVFDSVKSDLLMYWQQRRQQHSSGADVCIVYTHVAFGGINSNSSDRSSTMILFFSLPRTSICMQKY